MRKRESRFGACHPAVTFLFFMAAIVLTVTLQHPAYVAVSTASAASLLLTLQGRKAWRVLIGMVPLFILLAAVNPLFSTGGRNIMFYVFRRPYTWEALCYGSIIAAMLVATLLWFGCYNAVMTSDKFTCLFGSIIPSLSLILVMILRLIPSYLRKARQISGARRCIGQTNSGSLQEKVSEGMAVLSSLTSWALEGSIVTADSMRSRGYGTAQRTSFRLYRWCAADISLLAVMALLLSGVIAAGVMGWLKCKFIPVLTIPSLQGVPALALSAYALFLLLPTFLNVWEELKWTYSLSKI